MKNLISTFEEEEEEEEQNLIQESSYLANEHIKNSKKYTEVPAGEISTIDSSFDINMPSSNHRDQEETKARIFDNRSELVNSSSILSDPTDSEHQFEEFMASNDMTEVQGGYQAIGTSNLASNNSTEPINRQARVQK